MAGWAERVRRSEHPVLVTLKQVRRGLIRLDLPVPRALHPLLRALASGWRLAARAVTWLLVLAWRKPMFVAHCERVGRGLQLDRLPDVVGRPRIVIGDGVTLSGPIMITGMGPRGVPELVLGDGAWVGHATAFQVAGRIEIGERAAIAAFCYIADNDAHARAFGSRLRGDPPPSDEVRPVRVGKAAWIGRGSIILKGVTIGDGAIVAAGSVVTTDVPPFCVAMGNPARVVRREVHPADGAEADRETAGRIGIAAP